MRIRVRVCAQTPALYLVDKLGVDGAKDPFELLTLTADELGDAIATLQKAREVTSKRMAYVVGYAGAVEVDRDEDRS